MEAYELACDLLVKGNEPVEICNGYIWIDSPTIPSATLKITIRSLNTDKEQHETFQVSRDLQVHKPDPNDQGKTAYQKLSELNSELAKRCPGFHVTANMTGKLLWSLVSPKGEVLYKRDSLESIRTVSLKFVSDLQYRVIKARSRR